MKILIGYLVLSLLISACVGARDSRLVKYEAYSAELDQKAARGEISQLEADNLKIQAYQDYQETRRREEQQLLHDSISQQIKAQNQEINSILRQPR